MKYIINFKEKDQIRDIYLVKKIVEGTAKNGNQFQTVTLQDKTSTIDGKIWDLDSNGIGEFDEGDFVLLGAEVKLFNGAKQLTIKMIHKADSTEYNEADYFPVSEREPGDMYRELSAFIDSMKSEYFKKLLKSIFIENEEFKKDFKQHSAAKTVHHSFIGGLLEHTLSVTRICDFFSKNYPFLDRDLLISAALLHDIGKTKELSDFPQNEYTDEGQLLGHIIIATQMVNDALKNIPGFPKKKANELIHCILSHHGQLEFGSPKRPEIMEALALSFADNCDAKIETMKEYLKQTSEDDTTWLKYNQFLEAPVRRTSTPL